MNQKTIDNNLKALSELNYAITSGVYDYKLGFQICKRHKVNIAILTYAVRVGIFSRIAPGKYTSLVKKIDPIHARKVVESISDAYKAKNKKSTHVVKPKVDLQTKAAIKAKSVLKQPSRRRVSLFWGLLKFGY